MKFAISAVVVLGGAAAFAAPLGHTIQTNQAISMVNLASNADITLGTVPFSSDSLAVRPNGDLYSADAGGMMWKVSSMIPTPVAPLGFGAVGDLDYGSGGLWGFSNATGALFFFDLSTSTVTSQTVLSGLGSRTVKGVAVRPSDGSIFLSASNGFNNDGLFQVAGSVANPIGLMAHTDAFSDISDIDFDPATGKLYAMTWFHRHFYEVNTSSGATTLLSMGPHRDVTGLALQAVPEPATLAVLGLGALLLRRRKRS